MLSANFSVCQFETKCLFPDSLIVDIHMMRRMAKPEIHTNGQEKEDLLKSIIFSEDLPTIPEAASRLIGLLTKEDVDMAEIADLISLDVSLSSKLLKVVNSAFYGFSKNIVSISQAVNLLGLNAVQNLVLSVAFFSLKGRENVHFDYKKFWHSSLARAVAAKLIYNKIVNPLRIDNEQVFLSGLLQNIGKLILANTMQNGYRKVLQMQKEKGHELEDDVIEAECLGVDHSLTSYAIAKEWGFPDSLAQPLKYHHTPESYQGDDELVAMNAKICLLSDILAKVLSEEDPQKYHKLFWMKAKEHFSMGPIEINQILKEIHTEVDRAAEGFGLEVEVTKSIEEILMEANIKLSLLNMSYDEVNKKLIEQQVQLEKLTRELEEKNKILENLAYIDGLTGVNNHRFFQNALDTEISRASRTENDNLSLLMMDLDKFKSFNDTYGHQVGDFVLIEFCKVVLKQLRQHDILARYGGEEFVVILPETSEDQAQHTAERIRAAVAGHDFNDGNNSYSVTVSIGIGSGLPSNEDFSKDNLLAQADTALYDAKNSGRNRVSVFKAVSKKGWFTR